MAQRNYVQPQGQGAGMGQQPPQPPPSPEVAKAIANAEETIGQVMGNESIATIQQHRTSPLHFKEVKFVGMTPNDDNGVSLFRRWNGHYEGVRSDNERFTVSMTMLQNDTPYQFGPMFEGALQALWSYSNCECKPSTKAVCSLHAEAD